MLILLILISFISNTLCINKIDRDITQNTLLSYADSPFFVTNSITILKNTILTIEPGVILKISPRVKISVEGTMIANGSKDKRIVFTKAGSNVSETRRISSRLVAGEEVAQGLLQIQHRGQWRHVCSQNREWKQSDIQVACNEMGWVQGIFSLSGMAENDTSHMLITEPLCTGLETSISDCTGFQNASLGSSECNLQSLVGLHCWGALNRSFPDNWWGLTFYNSTMKESIYNTPNTRLNISNSQLNYVDISYAGVNWTNHRVSALSASPYPPVISNMMFSYNAYDALNFTDIRGPAEILHSRFENNSGHGFNITSSMGFVHLNNVTSRQNYGAGGYIQITSKHISEDTPELVDTSKTICGEGIITTSPVFPFLVLAEHQVPNYKSEDQCTLPITTDKPYQIISVKVLEASRDPTASAVITIVDLSTSRNLAVWNFTDSNTRSTFSPLDPLLYGPLYQGVSSTSQSIRVIYDWKKDRNQKYCPYLKQCFRGILQVTVGETTSAEVVVRDSLFESNVQQGLRVENLGIYAQILRSRFLSNQYWAGLQVVNGSSDLLVHDCRFANNDRTGLNISMAGGTRIVNASHFTNNIGYGLDIWNPTWLMTRQGNGPIENIVYLSTFKKNLWSGIRFYNSSLMMNILVNFSSFSDNTRNGIEMVAAIQNRNKMLTNFTVAFSSFTNNHWHGIAVSPIGQMTGKIENSTFTGHSEGGAIYIDNGVNFDEQRLLYRPLPIAYRISFNDFYDNSGPFVISVRLTQTSVLQQCEVSFNKFYNNRVRLRFNHLNPRQTASAVILIGSSNVRVNRNLIRNPQSSIDIATQLAAADGYIDATKNFWGTRTDFADVSWSKIHELVFRRLFDHDSRYSLGQIRYFPVLQDSNLHSNILSNLEPPYQQRFRNGTSVIIGGVIDVNIEQNINLEYSAVPYRVTRDIFVPQGVTLTVAAGVQLDFDNSIGLFVQGKVVLQGSETNPIKLNMTRMNLTSSRVEDIEIISKAQIEASLGNLSAINTTLVFDDMGTMNGIVRVRLNGSWGVMCDNRFELLTARIICAELGLVAHPMDWKLLAKEKLDNVCNDTILMSSVRCQTWHTRLSQCDYDGFNDHRCVSGIVNVRCHRPGWAGLKLSLTNEVSTLARLQISQAGLSDYYESLFQPALQIDYHKHVFRDVSISNSLSDGLLIQLNDLLSFNKISNFNSSHNLGSGAMSKSPWVTFDQCTFAGNRLAGLKFDPGFTEEALFELRSSMLKTLNLTSQTGGSVFRLGMHTEGIEVLSMPVGSRDEQTEYWTELRTTDPNNQQQLLVHLIDFNPDFRVENVTLYDNSYDKVRAQLSSSGTSSSITWSVGKETTRFPILSNGQFITIRIVVNGTCSGRLALLVQARSFIDLWNTGQLARDTSTANGMLYYPPTNFMVTNSHMTGNSVGISITHYNSATDSQNRSYTARNSELNVTISNNLLHNNSFMAIHVPSVSPYANDVYFPTYGDDISMESSSRIARIRYNITKCRFTMNSGILLAEHNHVPFSSNVWRYHVSGNEFLANNGSFTISMPFVSRRFDWRYLPNVDHTLAISGNNFSGNGDYQMIIDGYYARLSVTNNSFTSNVCVKQGVLSLRGMEKNFTVTRNRMISNVDCQYLVEVISDSQTDGAAIVPGYIGYNRLFNNTCTRQLGTQISCYSVGVFGNQNVTITRNILSNNDGFRYELVAGIIADGMLDARENYWGSVDIDKIRSRIFDINNWNNFVEVNFGRFLLEAKTNTTRFYVGTIPPMVIDVDKNFGGKISSNMFLMARKEPYVVRSDLTVMPGVELRIDAGVTLEVMPNVGILVLGKLLARGTVYRPIVMRPWLPPTSPVRVRRAIVTTALPSATIRLVAGNFTNEGFVQFFNDTAQRWDYMCDDQFSRDVAQVVCRQMGFSGYNTRIRRTHLLDYQLYGYDNPFITKYIWNNRYVCRGYENSTSLCVRRFNYNAIQCLVRRQFVFLRCGRDFLSPGESYWGNIRIILPGLEQQGRISEDSRSHLEYVNISKAGMLHEELVSAIQSTYAAPFLQYVSISQCAWNGIDIIAPRLYTYITNSSFTDNAGYAAGITVLNGDSSDPLTNSRQTLPMHLSPLPSSILGLMDICHIDKQITITDRILLYYRYSYRTIACTKLFRSTIPNKQIAVRFLQLNLYYDPFTRNSIELFNGFDFNTTEQLASINAAPMINTGDFNGFLTSISLPSYVNKFGYDSMGIHLYASPASEANGFIIELTTLPISPDNNYLDMNSFTQHRIVESQFTRNEAGGVRISGVGESNPVFDIYYNRFIDNGGAPMLNLTADPVILVRMENCRDINIANNYFYRNRGGTEMHLYSGGLNKAIRANFTNNVIVRNTNARALTMIGNYLSTVRVYRNFFTNNDCEYRDLIKVQGLLMKPFSYNYISQNRASVMINASGDENLSSKSEYLWNGFYDNLAINFTRSATVYCDNSKNVFNYNYFRNLRNDFELVVGNRSVMKEADMEPGYTCPLQKECITGWTLMLERNKCVCYRPDKLDARQNWWGENSEPYFKNKIWDQSDNQYLIPVDHSSYFTSNASVLGEGMYCLPTWGYYQKNCFYYFGAAMDYSESNMFCHTEVGAVLANSRDRIEWLGKLVASWQNNFQWLNKDTWNIRAWVHSYLPLVDLCPAIRGNWIEGFPCERRVQFFCQKSPNGAYLGVQMEFVIAIVVILIIMVLIVILAFILWRRNSQRRAKAFFVRCDFMKHRMGDNADPYLFSDLDMNTNIDNDNKTSTGHLYAKSIPFTESTTRTMMSSTRSKYDDDVMRMRRNTLDDTKESIRRPKSSSDMNTIGSRAPDTIDTALPMKNKYHQQRPKTGPKNTTLNSTRSRGSTEALYLKLGPDSQLRLSQPDVPRFTNPRNSRSNLHLDAADEVDDPYRMATMVDPLLDPSVPSRNRPMITRSSGPMRSVSTADSHNSDTSHLIGSHRNRHVTSDESEI